MQLCCCASKPKVLYDKSMRFQPSVVYEDNLLETNFITTFNNVKCELDLTRIQVWFYDKDYTCVHGSTDKYINKRSLQSYIGNNLKNTRKSDVEWKQLVKTNPKTVNSKKTIILNDNLIYVESSPMYEDDDMTNYYGLLLIVIPYHDVCKNLSFDDKQYTEINEGQTPKTYEPHNTERLLRTRSGFQEPFIRYRFLSDIVYELDLHRIQVWAFDKNKICIYGTQSEFMDHNLDHYLGKHIDELCVVMCTSLKKCIDDALNMRETKTMKELHGEFHFLNVRPLVYRSLNRKDVYGVLLLMFPYKYFDGASSYTEA